MADKKVSVFISAVDQVTAPLREIQASVRGFVSGAKELLLGLGAAFGAAALGSFFKASIDQANQADQAYRLLGVSLANIGVNAAAVRPQIDQTVQSLARLTGQDDSTLIGGLDRLIGLTGDYQKSLALLPLALDLAAARSLPLNDAIDLVGKTSNGSLTALKKLGLQAADSAAGLQLLQDRFGGAAEAMANPLQRLAVAWDQVKEAMGRALLGSDNFGKGVNPLIDALTQLEQVIQANEDNISRLATDALDLVADLVPVATFIGGELVESFHGWENLIGTLSANVQSIPPLFKIVLGTVVTDIGYALGLISGLLDKAGFHLLDGITSGVKAAGAQMVTDAKTQLKGVWDVWSEAQHDLAGDGAVSAAGRGSKPVSPTHAHARPAAALSAAALKSLQEQAKLAEQMAGFVETRVKGLTDLAALEQHINALLKDRNLSDKDRVALLTEQAAIEKAQLQHGEGAGPLVGQEKTVQRAGPHGEPLTLVESGGTAHSDHHLDLGARQAFGNPPGLAEVPDPMGKVTDGIHKATQAWGDFEAGLGGSELATRTKAAADSIDSVNASLGDLAGNAITNLSDDWGTMVDEIVTGSKSLGGALISTIQGAIGSAAKAEGQHSMVKALDDVADFLSGKNPAGLVAAAKHVAAGTAFFALGSALGSGGGGAGSVTAGGGGGLSPNTFTQNASATSGQGTVTVVLPRGAYVDPNSPEFQQFIADTIRNASGRNVTVQYQAA